MVSQNLCLFLSPGKVTLASPYAWKEFGPEPWQTGGLLPSAWQKASLQFQMHEIKSVSSGQCCHCWLSQGGLKGLFPIVFPRTCPKMFPSKPPSCKTPAEERRTIAHELPSSIAISRILAVTVNEWQFLSGLLSLTLNSQGLENCSLRGQRGQKTQTWIIKKAKLKNL